MNICSDSTTDNPSPMTVILIFQTVAKLINFDAKYKTIFQEAGLLHMLINLLKQFYLKNFKASSDDAQEHEGRSPIMLRSPKLHFTLQHKPTEEGSEGSLPGDEGSNYTVVMDCIALLLEGTYLTPASGSIIKTMFKAFQKMSGYLKKVMLLLNTKGAQSMPLRCYTILFIL